MIQERIVLGPATCQGCREEVVYMRSGYRYLGWLHASGDFRCPPKRRPEGMSLREYKRDWMRRKRAAA